MPLYCYLVDLHGPFCDPLSMRIHFHLLKGHIRVSVLIAIEGPIYSDIVHGAEYIKTQRTSRWSILMGDGVLVHDPMSTQLSQCHRPTIHIVSELFIFWIGRKL